MADEITGVVILQKMTYADIWRLWFEYTRSDGIIGYSTIPMIRKGDPRPPDYEGPLWNFVEKSPFLECSPSVRILGPKPDSPDHFHNTGLWTNYYVVMARPYGEEPDAFELIREINKPKTKEGRDAIILPYRAQGVFL